MRLTLHLDTQGLKSVDIESTPDERQQAHSLFQTLRPAIDQLGFAAQEAGREMENRDDEARG